MKNNDQSLEGLEYRGNGFFIYDDSSNPRLENLDVARKIGKHLSKRVTYISKSGYIGYTRHVLQYSHLNQKDAERRRRRYEGK